SGSGSGSGSGSSASDGLMKFAFGPEAFDRMTAALGTSIDALSDNDIAPYADTYLEYDSSGRVSETVVAAAGSAAGLGTFTYSYSTNSNASPIYDPNSWS